MDSSARVVARWMLACDGCWRIGLPAGIAIHRLICQLQSFRAVILLQWIPRGPLGGVESPTNTGNRIFFSTQGSFIVSLQQDAHRMNHCRSILEVLFIG